MNQNIIHWQWITYQNCKQLGYTEDDLGCILVEKHNSENEINKLLLSRDDEFDDFFAIFNINPIEQEGTIQEDKLSMILETTKSIWN